MSQVETSEKQLEDPSLDASKIPWDLTADFTRFVIQWSEQLHRVKVESIFDVLKKELFRREGLRAYGIKRVERAKPALLKAASSSVVSGEAARSIPAHAPKLLSNSEAA